MLQWARNPTNRSRCHIQFLSDLHLESISYDFDTERTASILTLGGDIGRFCDFDRYLGFLRKQSEKFDKILLVPGNHEFYGSSREEGLEAMQRMENDPTLRGRVTWMNRTRVDLEDHNVIILGCTLQSHIGQDYTRLTNDFARKDWTVAKHNTEHKLDVQWLKQTLQEIAETCSDKKVVIVTHYAPAFEKTCHPRNERNATSQCFSSDALLAFRHWMGPNQVTHWVFGHTHWNTRFKYGNTVVLSNQRCNDSKGLSWLQQRTFYHPFNTKAVLVV